VRLKCPDVGDFVAKFAPNVTRGGIFLPTHHTRDVGATIRFEITLADDKVVLAGEGVVTWAKPKGMGLKFTTLDPASEPMLERLLDRRQAPAAAERPAVVAKPAVVRASAAPPPKPAVPELIRATPPPPSPPVATRPAPPPPPPVVTLPTPPLPQPVAARPTPLPDPVAMLPTPPLGAPVATLPTPPLGAPVAMRPTPPLGAPVARLSPARRRSLFRAAFVLAAVAVVVVVVSVSVGRARVAARPSTEPAKPAPVEIAPAPAATPAVAIAPAPPAAAPEPPPIAPPPAPPATPARSSSRSRPGSVHVESIQVGPSYKRFGCPNPSSRLSVRSSKTVNVCLNVAHKPGRVDHLTLIWERDGAFSGKTHVEVPASRSNLRTRAHMRISEHRLGAWSVRVVSERDAPLAQATFNVVR
jgi:Tfp pilus assembly protein PilZ